ncbi:MAG: S8 family serine peptidase [Armatimonadetes bacterium]|nr:S8 family serine peptidase [Armatimonadota bacterium]MDE2207507.1 S8 family serine peptidase [Armatimonadota bacterium]
MGHKPHGAATAGRQLRPILMTFGRVAVLLLVLSGASAVRSAAQIPPLVRGFAPGSPPERPITQVMVKLAPGANPLLFAAQFSAVAARLTGANHTAVSQLAYKSSIPNLDWHVFRLAQPSALNATVAALKRMPGVLFAEPDWHIRAETLPPPNDTYWALEDWEQLIVVLSGLDSTDADARQDDSAFWTYTWNLEEINSLGAWNTFPGHYYTAAERKNLAANDPAKLPLVAVIDSGIDFSHADFAYVADVSTNPNQSTQTDISDGGQINTALARNFVFGNRNPNPMLAQDDLGHGTSVSGIIAAAANNGTGIPGLGFVAQLVPLKVIDSTGSGDDSDLVYALEYAAANHCVVCNVSLDLDTTTYPQALADAVDYDWKHGTLVVAAAGNDGDPTHPSDGEIRRYPASLVHVLAVAATAYGGDTVIGGEQLASYSNYGYELGVAAPGGDITTFVNNAPNADTLGLNPTQEYVLIWSTAPTYTVSLSDPTNPALGEYAQLGLYGLNYGSLPGTSLATPHVTALAALYAAEHGYSQVHGLPQKLINAIERGAHQMNARPDGGWDNVFGYGRIDAAETIADANPRAAWKGGVVGRITFGTTPVGDVNVVATSLKRLHQYSNSTYPDGIYHIVNCSTDWYVVRATVFGNTDAFLAPIDAGCDYQGASMPLDFNQVTITPNAYVHYGASIQFSATVTGPSNTNVIWSLPYHPKSASLSSTGLLKAPTAFTNERAVVEAQSAADPARDDMAIVTFVPSVTAVSVQPGSVTGGTSATGTVTLDYPASYFGATVTLSSDNSNAGVPATVTVAPGAKQATFTVTTKSVTSTATANIKATYYGTSASGALTINP